MNMKKVAQAFRLLADAMEETAERFEDTPAAADPVGVAGMDGQVESVPSPAPEPKPELEPTPTMTRQEFTTAMQKIGRDVGTDQLHAALPAVWAKYTNGVARMSAIPSDAYAEIVHFTRAEVEKQA